MKKFFQSAWTKCILTLLILSVISGGLLSILSDVLYVSPEERTMRAIKKIYGVEKEFSTVIDIDNSDESLNKPVVYDEFGTINKIYEVDKTQSASSYDLLFQSTGNGGYKGGTITVWVKVKVENGKFSIDKVILEKFTKQTLMSKLGTDFYNAFSNLKDITSAYNDGKFFSPDKEGTTQNPVTGATYSANAGNNAVNCVIKYLGSGCYEN